MTIAAILNGKRSEAVVVTAAQRVSEAVALLAARRIGAVSVMAGDLVKYRIDRIEADADAMRAYIQSA